MPTTRDYRTYATLDLTKVDASGKDVGKGVYWKLYAIENMVRVVVHSVLSAQVNPSWWSTAANATVAKNVANRIADYAKNPWHSTPGKHELYYCQLPELVKIMSDNVNRFIPLIPQTPTWIGRLEQLRLPRNVVGHMNWLTKADRQRIDVFHSDVQALLKQLATAGKVPLLIPPL